MNIGFVVARRLMLLGMATACSGVLSISDAPAETTVAQPYQVMWPSGWEVSYLPSPATNSGKNLGGERVRALLKADGIGMVAAIELTYFPRSDKGQANLSEEFAGLRGGVRSGFERQKLTVTITPLESQVTTLGGQSALTLELSAANDKTHLKQWLGMAMSPQFFYSLSFTANEENFARYRPQFDAVKQSIAFK